MNNQDGNRQYIWLRYAMQYSKDGRTHTVEMGVPMPLGASTEEREELLREAETGMNQLVQHVEQRASQALGRAQTTQNTGNQSSSATKSVSTALASSGSSTYSTAQPTETPSVHERSTPVQARPANRSASVPAPQTATQPANSLRTTASAGQGQDVPPNRPNIGASMPTSLSPNSIGSNLQIPEFVSYINENMNLKPKQAMDLLGVKSLSGINLREALEHLKRIVAQNGQSGIGVAQQPQQRQNPQPQQISTVREPRPVVSPPSIHQDVPTPIDELSTRPAYETLDDPEQKRESNVIEMRVPRQAQPARGFDEEIDEDDTLEELDDLGPASEFSSNQLDQAQDRIKLLRETQGAATASAARLQVLRNAADAEVSDEQLLELIMGVWNIQAMKKLKVDQVEALISWAKQDYFLEEIEVVLAVLEEERYARGNR